MKLPSSILIFGIWHLASGCSFAILDNNNNGLSDLWEMRYNNGSLFPETFDSHADQDFDSWTNEQEAAAGTNPFDPNSPEGMIHPATAHVPEVLSEPDAFGVSHVITPEAVTVSWPTISGKQYTLWFSPDLMEGNWFPVEQPYVADGGEVTYHFEINGSDKRFWRVVVNDVDSNGDGLTDAEAAQLGINAADADSDGDGWSDLEEAWNGTDRNNPDTDQDGAWDANDISPNDETASFSIRQLPRYAMFPITNAESDDGWPGPLQINDRGTVLYPDGTWSAGTWTGLADSNGNLVFANATAINDSDMILGTCWENPGEDLPTISFDSFCYWPSPSGQPSFIEVGGLRAGLIFDYGSYELYTRTYIPGPLLANDGGFYCHANRMNQNQDAWEFVHDSRWKLPSDGQPASEMPGGSGLFMSAGPELQWGRDGGAGSPNGRVVTTTPLPSLPFIPLNVTQQPGGAIIAMPSAQSDHESRVFINNSWKTSPTYAHAIDMGSDGTAIGKAIANPNSQTPSICINGKWTYAEKAVPSIPAAWSDSTLKFTDTTQGGWILAQRGGSVSDPLQSALMLPIRVDGVDDTVSPANLEDLAAGVDRNSVGADSGSGYVPEIWIMAPVGGSNTARFLAPLNTASTLKLECDKVTFSPALLNAAEKQIQIGGDATASEDVQPVLKLGNQVESISVPFRIKVMKKRVVKVALHKVLGLGDTSVQTSPQYMPTKAQLEDYLNDVYGRQVNTTFNVTLHVESGPNRPHPEEEGIDFDLNNDHKVMIDDSSPELQAATPNAKSTGIYPTANIDVWVIGGDIKMYYRGFRDERAAGKKIGGPSISKAIIDGSLIDIPNLNDAEKFDYLLHTIAHEIGHVMIASGHPDQKFSRDAVVLKWNSHGGNDPHVRKRLMCSGETAGQHDLGKCLLKKEWDKIEAWLKNEEDNGRL